ncbi:MAG: patatin-like phospholipase family protein [Anaerolineales bacterium]|nr:patatin-like phospholipase family protein [Anaerolineales bacterium]MCB8961414.1 patatin-like phospholipase family protein [Ardenticatenales bacterium]
MSEANKTTVSLVLGSGGARGLAHIGVIHWLEEHGYAIKSVSGTSIGSLIGGVYATGKLGVLEAWMRALTKTDMLALMDIAWKRDGILKGDKLFGVLAELIGDELIEALPIPFTAVAFDIHKEKEIWLQNGRLFDAIRASCSIPLVLTPVTHGSGTLIDGGIINPVPIAPTFGDGSDLIVAVNLGGPPSERPSVERAEPPAGASPAIKRKIASFIKSLSIPPVIHRERGMSPALIYYLSIDAMQSAIARQKIAAYPPDKLIEVPRNACGTMDFDRAAELIELGYEAAEAALGHPSDF